MLLASSAKCLVFVSQHCRIQARRCKAWRGDWPDERSWTPRRGGPSAGSASGSSGGSQPPVCSGPCWGGPACRTTRKHTAHITAWTHSLLNSAKVKGPEESVHPKCGPCWGGPPCRMQTHSCHRDLYNHWNSIWQKGCWGPGHPNYPMFVTRV